MRRSPYSLMVAAAASCFARLAGTGKAISRRPDPDFDYQPVTVKRRSAGVPPMKRGRFKNGMRNKAHFNKHRQPRCRKA